MATAAIKRNKKLRPQPTNRDSRLEVQKAIFTKQRTKRRAVGSELSARVSTMAANDFLLLSRFALVLIATS